MTTTVRRRLLFVALLFLSAWPITFDARLAIWALAAYVFLGEWA